VFILAYYQCNCYIMWLSSSDGSVAAICMCLTVCYVCSDRTCLNPILPQKPPPKKSATPGYSQGSEGIPASSLASSKSPATSSSRMKRVIEKKSYRAMLSPSEPGIDTPPDSSKLSDRRHSHKLFGRKKLASTLLSSSLSKLKHRMDRMLSGDGPLKRRSDPWKKRRSLLACDRSSPRSGMWSPHRVPSSSSLASLSDTDISNQMSQSRNVLKVVLNQSVVMRCGALCWLREL